MPADFQLQPLNDERENETPADSLILGGSERVNDNDLSPQADEPILPVVGLGGSAGSIGALQEFFGRIPTDLGIAYVVVVHLSADFESQLPQVLQTRTRMPVVQVQGSVKVEANHVYVIPPAHHLRMEDGHIHLSPPEQERGQRVAVDLFFRTLAASRRSRAVAVVLSGLDGDGAIGIKRIKEHGGVTIAQDPDEAEHPSMPRSAIDTGMVDWILSVEQMTGKLAQWIGNERRIHLPPAQTDESAPPLGGEAADETALREVLSFLHARTGHDFSHYKRATVLRRILRRLQVNSLESLPQYADFLRTHPGESGALLQDLLISVTNFFRDPEAFSALSNFVPRLFRDKGSSDAVRVWVAGCATGEEAYSLAILLDEYAQTLDNPPEIQIFASDLDEQALKVAREATYPATIAADVSPERLRRYFVLDQNRYRVKKELRERVLFAAHNLLSDSPFSRLDLVSCRNLLIYFGREAQNKVLSVFHFALKPDGLMFLGGSESTDENVLFRAQDKKHRIYERQSVRRSQLPILPAATLTPSRAAEMARFRPPAPSFVALQAELAPSASYSELHLRLLEQSSPPSVLVNANYEIVHLSEHAGRFLRFAGEMTMNLLSLVHPALRLELRTALFRAVQTGEDVNIPAITLEFDGKVRRLGARVRPMREREDSNQASSDSGFLLVIFDEATESADAPPALPTTPDDTARRLEEELQYLKMQLRGSVEQYEASGEELKASNEELQAMNEEQRSAGEELETSREEIQAANEELSTVNAELKLKIEEISRTNSDLQNLMASTDIATVFLSRDLKVMRYTPRAVDLFRLIPSDEGRPLADLRHRFGTQSLTEDADRVLRNLATVEREISSDDGQWFLLRVSPYRTLDDRIDGVVLGFVDISGRKRAEAKVRESEARLHLLIDSARDYAIFTLDNERRVTSWSPGAQAILGFSEAEIVGQLGDIVFVPEDRAQGAPERETRLARDEGRAENERVHVRKDGSRFYGSGTTSPLRNGDGELHGFVKIMRDLSEQKAAQDALAQNEARQAYLIQLGDALRPLSDPLEIQRTAMRVLGEHLQADRVLYSEIELDNGNFVIADNYARGNVAKMVGRFPLSDYDNAQNSQRRGETFVLPDIRSAGESDEHAAFLAVGVEAIIGVPLLKDGRWVASLSVHHGSPREWTPEDAALVGETAERTWAAVERARAEAALAASEEKFRTLFDSIDEGFSIVEVILDAAGTVTDFRFREINAACERLTGLSNIVGKLISEVMPQVESYWMGQFDHVVRTGEPRRIENFNVDTGRWYQASHARIGGAGSRLVGTVFDDISGRKRREANLDFLAEVSQDLVQLTNVDETMNALGARIGAHFRASQCVFGEVSEDGQSVTVTHEWKGAMAPSLKGTYRVADYSSDEYQRACEAGETFIVRDVTADWRINAEQMTAIGVGAFVTVPLVRDGAFRFNLNIYDSAPRDWHADEIELMREITTRIWTRLERARAEAAMRVAEERYLVLFNSIEQGFCILEMAFDDDQKPTDYRFVEVNPSFERQTGIPNATGRWMREIAPNHDQHWFDIYGRIAQSGKAERFENYSTPLDRWWSVYAFRTQDPAQRRVGVFFFDISARKRAEAALHESEGQYRLLVDSVSDILYKMSADWSEMRSLDGKDFLANSDSNLSWLEEYIPESDKPLARATIAHAIASKSTFELEHRVVRADGSLGWTFSRAIPLLDENGEIVEWFGTASDISARKSAEELLQASEARYRLSVEAAGMATWEWNLQTDEVIWNDLHFALFGMESRPNPVTPADFSRHIHPDDAARIGEALQIAIETRTSFEEEFRAILESGEERWMSGFGRVFEEQNGVPLRMSGVMFDITERRLALTNLRESEARLRALAENLPGGAAFIVDRDLRYLAASGEALVVTGFTPDDFIGRTLYEVLPPELAAGYEPNFRQALAGEPYENEHEAHGRTFLSRGVPLRRENGEVYAVLAVSYDITERKIAEEKVRRSEDQFRTVTDEVPQIIWTNEAEGKANLFNSRWFEYSGRSLEDSMGLGWQIIVHPDDAPASVERWNTALAEGKIFDTEYRLRRYDGEFRWHIGRNVPLRGENEQVTGWFGTATDIEDLKQAEGALRESGERFRAIFEQATAGVAEYDLQGCHTFSNDTFREALGYSCDELLALNLRDIAHPDDLAHCLDIFERAKSDGGSFRCEKRLICKNGEIIWIAESVSGIRDANNQTQSVVAVSIDITQRKHTEGELQRSHELLEDRVEERTNELAQALEQVSAEVVQRRQAEAGRDDLMKRIVNTQEDERGRISRELHDNLGQHLTAVMFGLQALETQLGDKRKVGATQLDHLRALVDGLMSAAHRQAWELRPAELDAMGLEAALGQYIRDWTSQTGVAVGFQTVNWEQRADPIIETTLYRVIQEALTNVARHANATQVSVVLERSSSGVSAIIEDDGAGFDPEASENGRLGLLGMSERIMLVNGTIEIESSPGSGTTIFARVPAMGEETN